MTPLAFWRKVRRVDGDGCWAWLGAKNPRGYGKVYVAGRTVSAHRFSYEDAYGPVESSQVFVCHTCDNPTCVRPDHLFLGTRADNMADMKQKGRWALNGPRRMRKGESHPMAKLSDVEIEALKQLRQDGLSYARIAAQMALPQSTVYQVITGLRRAV